MRVALITLEGGGIATVCYGLAHHLSIRKTPVTVFTETSKKHEVTAVSDTLTIDSLRRVELPPRFFWFQLQNLKYLLRKTADFNIIHGVYPDASTFLAHYKQKLAKPFVASFHAEPLSNAKEFINTPFSSWTLPDFAHQILEYPPLSYNLKICAEHADRIIVCSLSALKEFQVAYKNLNPDRVSVIYNAVDLEEIKQINSQKDSRVDCENLSIIFAGRLFWVKGLLYLLKAFELVSHGFKKVHLNIYGKGPEENKFKKFVSTARLDDKVHFHGRIPNKALIAEIKRADAVVMPSLHEAQSLFAIEAMACQKPLIAFDIPSMREIIDDGKNGVLAKSFDYRDLAEKIRVVLADRKLRLKLGQNAYEYVKEKHNWNNQIKKYIKIYESLL